MNNIDTAPVLNARANLGHGYRSVSPKRVAHIVALVLAILGAAVLAFAPTYIGSSTDGIGPATITYRTAFEVNGLYLLFLVAVPIVLTLIPLLIRDRALHIASIACTVLLLFAVLISFMSIGVFFLPAALAALVAVFLQPRKYRG
ncbi:MAG: hypothetical protein Q4G30_10330 [Actinomycetaceae bacterium]|nr:hypothetical protein [Actinomycetaceae bacterium]